MTLNRPTIKKKIPARAQSRLISWSVFCTQLEASVKPEKAKFPGGSRTSQPLNTLQTIKSNRSLADHTPHTKHGHGQKQLTASIRDNIAASPREEIKTPAVIKTPHVPEELQDSDKSQAERLVQTFKGVKLSHRRAPNSPLEVKPSAVC